MTRLPWPGSFLLPKAAWQSVCHRCCEPLSNALWGLCPARVTGGSRPLFPEGTLSLLRVGCKAVMEVWLGEGSSGLVQWSEGQAGWCAGLQSWAVHQSVDSVADGSVDRSVQVLSHNPVLRAAKVMPLQNSTPLGSAGRPCCLSKCCAVCRAVSIHFTFGSCVCWHCCMQHRGSVPLPDKETPSKVHSEGWVVPCVIEKRAWVCTFIG